MFFTVDPSNGVAIYLQIVNQIKFAIAEQTLRPGQLLPSVRALSRQLTVNPNTVSRALQQLQTDGIVETMRGRGAVVCQGAVERCKKHRRAFVADRITTVVTEALQGGLAGNEIRELVESALVTLDGNVATVTTSGS